MLSFHWNSSYLKEAKCLRKLFLMLDYCIVSTKVESIKPEAFNPSGIFSLNSFCVELIIVEIDRWAKRVDEKLIGDLKNLVENIIFERL